jgi:hypothetical protein
MTLHVGDLLVRVYIFMLCVSQPCRLWKGLAIWRRAVRWSKASNCAEVLNRDLFTVDPALQAAIKTVRLVVVSE